MSISLHDKHIHSILYLKFISILYLYEFTHSLFKKIRFLITLQFLIDNHWPISLQKLLNYITIATNFSPSANIKMNKLEQHRNTYFPQLANIIPFAINALASPTQIVHRLSCQILESRATVGTTVPWRLTQSRKQSSETVYYPEQRRKIHRASGSRSSPDISPRDSNDSLA